LFVWLSWLACTPQTDAPAGPGSSVVSSTLARAPRNLLMISIDTTRRDYIDRYATDEVVRTPFLSGLLAEGVALDDHQQCSNWTFQSTSCTLEGRMNEETGWIAKLAPATRTPVPAGRRTLAVRLREKGWHSVLVTSNEWLSDTWNNAQGYNVIRRETTASTPVLLTSALKQLQAATDLGHDRWFVHVHLLQAHPAYTPPDPYDDEVEALPPIPWNLDDQMEQYGAGAEWPEMTEQEQDLLVRHLKARYTGELQYQDDQLAQWWDRMDRGGWLDDTLVVIWTDHGEQFFEHGFQAHAYVLGAEENDAILGLWAKDMEPLAWDGPTHAVDLVPTVLDAMGVPAEGDELLEGYVLGTAPPDRVRTASSVTRLGPMVSVTKDHWKLFYSFGGSIRLWDRSTDRAELTDLYSLEHPQVQELWPLARARADRLAPLAPEWPITWPEGL
jgi:arylsulfatase A-like enzyme